MKKLTEILNLQDMNNLNSVNPDTNDYEKDGLIYCGVCNTQKQVKINLGGRERVVKCMCKCESDAYKREQEEARQRARLEMVKNLKINSLMGERYANANFDNCLLESESFATAYERCKKFCENSKEVLDNGYGIYLWGTCGIGKTHLMACMCNELTSQLRQCLFTNFFEISKSIRATFNTRTDTEESLMNKISDVDFLFIDDLGTEQLRKGNEDTWIQEKIYDIINKRYNTKKPTIFSSNYNFSELIKDRGMMVKTVDRIVEMSNAVVKIEGNSFRTRLNKHIPF